MTHSRFGWKACGGKRWETTRDDDCDVGESFCIPISSIFSPRSFIRDPRVVRACVSSRARAREREIQHGTSRRHRHSDARPHSDARWRPRSHDPARSAIHFIQLVSDFTILIHVVSFMAAIPYRRTRLNRAGSPRLLLPRPPSSRRPPTRQTKAGTVDVREAIQRRVAAREP